VRHAFHAKEVFVASFLTADAVVEYVKRSHCETVSLVLVGKLGIERMEDDDLCAEYIKEKLEGGKPDFEKLKEKILAGPSAKIFLDKNMPDFLEEDLHLALQVGKFDFVLRADKARERLLRVDV